MLGGGDASDLDPRRMYDGGGGWGLDDAAVGDGHSSCWLPSDCGSLDWGGSSGRGTHHHRDSGGLLLRAGLVTNSILFC